MSPTDSELLAGRPLTLDSRTLDGRTLDSRTKLPTAVLLEQPAWYNAHSALPPAPLLQPSLIERGLCDPPTTLTAARLSFPFTTLLSLVVDALTAANSSVELPSVAECGLIGSYLCSEVQRSTRSLHGRSAQEMEQRIDRLCSSLLDPALTKDPG